MSSETNAGAIPSMNCFWASSFRGYT